MNQNNIGRGRKTIAYIKEHLYVTKEVTYREVDFPEKNHF